MSSTSLPAALCALFLAVGAGAKDSRKPDAWITTKVKSSLATHKNVSALGTHVETKGGMVILRGEVNTTAEKELAEQYVKEVDGVRGVDNRLTVKGERGDMKDEDRDDTRDRDTRDRGDRDRSRGELRDEDRGVGDKAIESIGNASLTGRVKSALAAQRGTSAIRTEVDSDRGSVVLSGTARSNAERDLAEKTVRGVKGVKDVDNRIEVR